MKGLVLLIVILFTTSCNLFNENDNTNNNYFPLASGDTLKFNLRQAEYIMEDRSYNTGSRKWIVKEVELVNGFKKYHIQNEESGESKLVNNYHSGSIITYKTFNRKYDFIIEEKQDTIYLGGVKFKKINSSEEYLQIFNNENFKLKLRKNYGIDEYYSKSTGGHHYIETWLERIYE